MRLIGGRVRTNDCGWILSAHPVRRLDHSATDVTKRIPPTFGQPTRIGSVYWVSTSVRIWSPCCVHKRIDADELLRHWVVVAVDQIAIWRSLGASS